ncbi:hypothetical protein AAGR08_09985 [Pantoea sp. BRR-3P]|uniref:hypothetical protein n=1 Tax=Pantoea sp. BRR-3P TaxID=3141541 RepID=UPI0031F5C8FC
MKTSLKFAVIAIAVATSFNAFADTKISNTLSGPSAESFGQNYVNAKNETSQTMSNFGKSYIDAKNGVQSSYVKNDPTGTPLAAGSINVSAGSLPANTPVNVQSNDGKITTVAASTLSPAVQVSVPHVDAIINSPSLKGGQQSHDHGHTHNGGQGNGESNAANTNSAHGMGGANHIGGGAAQSGSQNVGHW